MASDDEKRMNKRWLCTTSAALAGLAVPMLLAGCSIQEKGDVVSMAPDHLALLRTADAGGTPTSYAVQAGTSSPLPLPDHVAARITGAWALGTHRLAVITGATKECQYLETLVVIEGRKAQLRQLGKCQDRFAFWNTANQWTARQSNTRDPVLWSFLHGNLSGPTLLSATASRSGRPDGASRATETGSMPNAISPPTVSSPVGDDVVPPPVGAGPLPGRSSPSPRVF